MKLDAKSILATSRRRFLAVDANLLVLWAVAVLDPRRIPEFKRTTAFLPEDGVYLRALVSRFERVYATPNCFTEASNLLASFPDERMPEVFRQVVESAFERYLESRAATHHAAHANFGLSDAVLVMLAEEKVVILTSDARLSAFLEHRRLPVLNFNHLRIAFPE